MPIEGLQNDPQSYVVYFLVRDGEEERFVEVAEGVNVEVDQGDNCIFCLQWERDPRRPTDQKIADGVPIAIGPHRLENDFCCREVVCPTP